MNAATNANNKRPVPCDETWSNLSDDAQRRWRANRTAKRKFRQHTSGLVAQCPAKPPAPFPPAAVQHDGQVRVELNSAMGSPVPGSERAVSTVNMVPPMPPGASPASTVDSFNQLPKSHTDDLLHLLEFPAHMSMPSPSRHDRVTPSFHLPKPSEEPAEQTSLETRFTPTSHPEDTPRSTKLEPAELEVECVVPEVERAESSSRMGTASASPAPNDLGSDAMAQHKQPHEDYLLSPLSSLVSPHSNASKSCLTDVASTSTITTTPSDSPALNMISPCLNLKSPALKGLGITMKMPEPQSAYVTEAGETALHKAAAGGHEMMTQLLLEGGADTELSNSVGRRPLHLAAENGHLRVVGVLVDAGADLEAPDYTGSRPLHLAAMRGHEDVARFLLWKGAHVNAVDLPGQE